MKSRAFQIIGLFLVTSALLMFGASSASALTLGLMFTGASNTAGHQEPNESSEEWSAIKQSGAKLFRLPVTPAESSNGTNWSYYDKVFRLAAESGVAIEPILGGRLNGALYGLPTATEKEKEEWYIWVKKAVKRYGYNGSFWAENPGVPAAPATAWEVWNEPNNAAMNGGSQINPESYGAFLVYTSAAIQSASQEQAGVKTGVLFGGLLIWNNGTGYQSYVNQAYKIPGVSSSYTGLAIHPYEMGLENPIGSLTSSINGVRSFLNSKPEGGGKSIWITEMGWATEREYGVGEAKQASLLTESFNWIKGAAATDNIQALIWYNYRDSDISNGWQYRCGLRDEMGNYRLSWFAFQEQTGKPRWPTPTIAFQANTESLWTVTQAAGGRNTLLGMAKETSPSIGLYKGAFQIAFQANTGTLFTATPTIAEDTGQKIAPGTSPSVPPLEGGVVAYQASNGNLSYKEGNTIVNTSYGMAAGTSPSITTIPARYWHNPTRYAIAFQANNGNLWFLEPGGAVVNTGLGMAPGTSPSIAALDGPEGENKRFVIVFQANTTQLWLYEPGGTVSTTGLGMRAGTSPHVTALTAGKYAVAFQANTTTLWTYEPGGSIANTGLGMPSGTSPSVSALSDWPYYRPFKVALNTTSGSLWTYEPGGSIVNTLYGFQPGTSPSIGPG
jgi:hypothetical protein